VRSDSKIKAAADRCLSKGISVIPIGEDKIPAIRWMGLIDKPLEYWNFPGCNMGIITGATNGIVVVDCDDRRSALLWLSTKTKTPLMAITRRGMHFYYRHPGGYVKSGSGILMPGGKYDIKADRSFVLCCPSVNKGHEYKFLPHDGNPCGKWMEPDKLPVFDRSWRPESASRPTYEHAGTVIRDARAVINKITAGEGERDKATYHAIKVVQESGASESEAVAIVVDWHLRNCIPPWDVMTVASKVQRVYNRG
jgi:hypothetical protein